MKKERIEVTRNSNYINFYLVVGAERLWLFSQEYSQSVYEYFKDGRAIGEFRKNPFWRSNPRLAKTIDRMPSMMRYVKRENGLPYKTEKKRYFYTTYRDMYAI